jgi:threonine dehydratase
MVFNLRPDDDELAKMHIRHLVGGKSALAENELLYRFEFPERPGALTRFLNSMAPNWNISLFHYRNHGADYARILVGLQDEKKMKLSANFYPHSAINTGMKAIILSINYF